MPAQKLADEEERTQNYVSWTVFLVFLLIGIPVWWKTTQVYRAVLPSAEIQDLYDNKQMEVSISVILSSNTDQLISEKLATSLQNKLNAISGQFLLSFSYNVAVADNVKVVGKRGQLVVEFLHGTPKIKVTSKRKIIVSTPSVNEIDLSQLVSIIKNSVVKENFLGDVAREVFEEVRQETDNSAHLQKMVKGGSRYELLFSLLLMESETRYFDWNIREAINNKLASFLHQMRSVYEINVSSQVLFSNPPYFFPHKSAAGDRYVTEGQLSQVVNKVEGRLGSQISSDPTLSMVVNVISEQYDSVHILKDDGKKSITNSFLIPRWGAMILHNVADNHTSDVLTIDTLMPIFVGHLRVLLAGLDNQIFLSKPDNAVVYDAPKSNGITEWELDFLFRLKSIENVASAVHTLHSLAKLLNKINDIVINDVVAGEIYAAVDTIKRAKTNLNVNKLELALNNSKVAFRSSEKAFFDPTLLEMLYFPEDQKFAIYCPLFVPIILTLVTSMSYTMKRRKNKVKED